VDELAAVLRSTARLHPDRTAIVDERGARTSYQMLIHLATTAARELTGAKNHGPLLLDASRPAAAIRAMCACDVCVRDFWPIIHV